MQWMMQHMLKAEVHYTCTVKCVVAELQSIEYIL